MGSVPAFLLKRLYVKGSLKNTETGFELTIQNTLAPGTIVGLEPLQIDGVSYPLEQTTATLPSGSQVSATELSAASPQRFGVGDRVRIHVQAQPLAPGLHRLIISPKTMEAGLLQILAEDAVP
ncbi:MAG: hydroxymethylglutaryl-CoA reductase [Chloroflexi bacterium]|nr:hydroxymethylglutaryl-CoA reductase [Chloroflexota bacterium]